MRIWLDTVTLAEMEEPIDVLQRLIQNQNMLVIANTILDVKAFQESIDWVEEMLKNGHMSIEIWSTPDEMVAKPFFWSSAGIETSAANSLEEAISNLPNKVKIMALKELLDEYGIQKADWPKGQWAPPEPISEEIKEVLGLNELTTRTEILHACKKAHRMDLFDSYNVGYNRGLASQHTCGGILNSNGTVECI